MLVEWKLMKSIGCAWLLNEIHWLCLVAYENVESENLKMFDNKQDNQKL